MFCFPHAIPLKISHKIGAGAWKSRPVFEKTSTIFAKLLSNTLNWTFAPWKGRNEGVAGVRLGRERGQNNPDNVCIFRRTLTQYLALIPIFPRFCTQLFRDFDAKISSCCKSSAKSRSNSQLVHTYPQKLGLIYSLFIFTCKSSV